MVILTKAEDNPTVEYYDWKHHFTGNSTQSAYLYARNFFISEVFYMYRRQVVRNKKQNY